MINHCQHRIPLNVPCAKCSTIAFGPDTPSDLETDRLKAEVVAERARFDAMWMKFKGEGEFYLSERDAARAEVASLRAALAEATQTERERCAKVADEVAGEQGAGPVVRATSRFIAAAIRGSK